MRLFILCILFFAISCVSSKKYSTSQATINRLQIDSSLLEKHVVQLKTEVAYYRNQSATIEQALNNRLQEKEDSLAQKELLLVEKEVRILDMKSRKAQEKEAFSKLSSSISKEFTQFPSTQINAYTTCTQTAIEVSDHYLFIPNTSKLDMQADPILQTIATVLKKNIDLQVLVVNYTDSLYTGKEKWDDNWAYGSAKATALVKYLVKNHGVLPIRVMPTTQAQHEPLLANSKTITKPKTVFLFYTNLLPCVHLE